MDVAETIDRIKSNKGVIAVIVATAEGVPIRFSKGLDDDVIHKYAKELAHLTAKSRASVREIDQDDLIFFRVRSNKHEFTVSPGKDYLLIVVSDPKIAYGK